MGFGPRRRVRRVRVRDWIRSLLPGWVWDWDWVFIVLDSVCFFFVLVEFEVEDGGYDFNSWVQFKYMYNLCRYEGMYEYIPGHP